MVNPILADEKELIITTRSDRETIRCGRDLAAGLQPGDVIGLVGELGSGKTWFTKGLIRGLGVDPGIVVTSPTFALVNDYQGRLQGSASKMFPVYHMDLYRLNNAAEWTAAGLDEYLDGQGIVIIEWAERCPEILPPGTLMIYFTIRGEQQREIRVSGRHPRHVETIGRMATPPEVKKV